MDQKIRPNAEAETVTDMDGKREWENQRKKIFHQIEHILEISSSNVSLENFHTYSRLQNEIKTLRTMLEKVI